MSAATFERSRTQVWLESLGEWSWPGQGAAAAASSPRRAGMAMGEVLPPPWVPTFPLRREPRVARPALPVAAPTPARARARRLLVGTLLGTLAVICLLLCESGALTLSSALGTGAPVEAEAAAIGPTRAQQPLPTLDLVSADDAGSSILRTSFASAALHGEGSFLVYLPKGYASTDMHYPVVYMLTGDDQSDSAFLQVGLQSTLDRLIAAHTIPPLMAVMIQGGPGANLWRNAGSLGYESYILEVQEMVDRALPTIRARDARAIVGDSMGGYGAMNAALANPYRFGVVESWIGFFNGLEGDLRADRAIFARLGLRAFVYGAEQDQIANPAEDLPFAAALRAAGADAQGAIYPGEHNLGTVEAHLESMLAFAGRALRHS
jgi:hypothetical protein